MDIRDDELYMSISESTYIFIPNSTENEPDLVVVCYEQYKTDTDIFDIEYFPKPIHPRSNAHKIDFLLESVT